MSCLSVHVYLCQHTGKGSDPKSECPYYEPFVAPFGRMVCRFQARACGASSQSILECENPFAHDQADGMRAGAIVPKEDQGWQLQNEEWEVQRRAEKREGLEAEGKDVSYYRTRELRVMEKKERRLAKA